MFDVTSFDRRLQTGWLARRFWYFAKLPSTNRYLNDLPGNRLSHGLVCLADNQTGGKGQFGKVWHSSPGENLTFTTVLKPVRNTGLQLFSLAFMLSLKETLHNKYSCECVIKWPNDLVVNEKKVAGLLTECRYNGKMLDRMFIGLGVNVNQKIFNDEIKDLATSLRLVAGGQPVDRSMLLVELLNRLEPLLDLAEDGDMNLIRAINRCIQGYGEWVTLHVDGKRDKKPVKILGINEFGYMTVLTANDEIRTFTHEHLRIDVAET